MHHDPRALRERKAKIVATMQENRRQAENRRARRAWFMDHKQHVVDYVSCVPSGCDSLQHAPARSKEFRAHIHGSVARNLQEVVDSLEEVRQAEAAARRTARKAQHNPDPLPCDHPHFNQEAHNMVTAIGWFVTALCGILFLISLFK